MSPSALYEGPVVAVFLQEHRSLLVRGLIVRLLGRVVGLGTAVSLAIGTHFSASQLRTLAGLGILVCILWLIEQQILDTRAARLQQILARGTDADEQDFFIRSRYQYLRIVRLFRLWPPVEPIVWMLAIYFVLVRVGAPLQ